MRAAYREAGWNPAAVDLIECHATGTPVGDAVEYRSLRTLWGDAGWRRGQCVLGSVKATVGHLLTAAGAAGLVKVLSALGSRTLPPTANFATPAPGLDLDQSPFRILTAPEPWPEPADGTPRRAALSAFGFGGINAHVLLEELISQRSCREGEAPAEPHAPGSAGASPSQTRQRSCREGEAPAEPHAPGSAGASPSPIAHPSALTHSAAPPIAVIAMDAHFGPWSSLTAVRERVLGGSSREPAMPTHWWGIEKSRWLKEQGLSSESFAGYFIPELMVALDRFRIPPHELQEMLSQQVLMLQVAAGAIGNVQLTDAIRERTGVYVGLGLDLNTTNFTFRWSVQAQARTWAERRGLSDPELHNWVAAVREAAGPALNANRTMGALGSIVASRVAREFHLGGPSFTVSSEDTSGVHALETAIRSLQSGSIDAALVGAVDLAGDVRAVLASHRLSRGIPGEVHVLGEGAAALVLKRLTDAERDGDRILAVIRGIEVARRGDVPPGWPDADAVPSALEANVPLISAKADVGHAGAATDLAALVKAILCLENQVLANRPQAPMYFLHDRASGPRRVAVACAGITGTHAQVLLEEHISALAGLRRQEPLGPRPEALFIVPGNDVSDLLRAVDSLQSQLEGPGSLDDHARRWFSGTRSRSALPLALAMVARHVEEAGELLQAARQILGHRPDRALPSVALPTPLRDRLFYSPAPLGPARRLAFVYPGSGNDFPGMGRDLAVHWPEVLRGQQSENLYLRSQYLPECFWQAPSMPVTHQNKIFVQVALGTLVTDLLGNFGVRPDAALGYSLGESAALFALRAWTDRDRMLQATHASPLFTSDLVGDRRAARTSWGLPDTEAVDWFAGLVSCPAAQVREALAGEQRVYLLIINTPTECVLGGDRAAVARVVQKLGCRFLPLPDTATVHCPIAGVVADAYRELHRLPTTAPPGVRFYSAALGRAYELNQDSAAEAILAQALDTVDFPALIENAYADGVRLFVEIGPGASCSRLIPAILGERPHRVRAACPANIEGVSAILRVLALLAAERVPINLASLYRGSEANLDQPARRMARIPVGRPAFRVPLPESGANEERPFAERKATNTHPMDVALTAELALPELKEARLIGRALEQTTAALVARTQAHATYLRFTECVERSLAQNLAFQTTLLEMLTQQESRIEDRGSRIEDRRTGSLACPADLADRQGCLSYDPRPSILDPPRTLDRNQCLEFATGSIGRVLGPTFAAIDAFPTRVRLPDEPLMLVDRIVAIEGEPLSLDLGVRGHGARCSPRRLVSRSRPYSDLPRGGSGSGRFVPGGFPRDRSAH